MTTAFSLCFPSPTLGQFVLIRIPSPSLEHQRIAISGYFPLPLFCPFSTHIPVLPAIDECNNTYPPHEQVCGMGGAEKIAKHHAQGRLTVRERIALLLDDGT